MTSTRDHLSINDLYALCCTRLTSIYEHYLAPTPSTPLKNAMTDIMLHRGKLVRPMLIYASGFCFDAPLDHLDVPASAVEIIHTYSLIHDDLPCMDNADFRRGKPTLHRVYNEAIAVLTGDALHTLSMQILANHKTSLTAEQRIRMIATLATACGPYGMAAGQAFDITVMQDQSITSDTLLEIYRLKTGALFTACLELGYHASHDQNPDHQAALRTFGDHIGLAFQIQDDILDIESSTATLGKPQGLDARNEKITYPKLVGLLEAKADVDKHYQLALSAIKPFGEKANLLRELTAYLLRRNK